MGGGGGRTKERVREGRLTGGVGRGETLRGGGDKN